MAIFIRSTCCPDLEAFADELKRLANLGLIAAVYPDVRQLQPGEFMVDKPVRQNIGGTVCVYYREASAVAAG